MDYKLLMIFLAIIIGILCKQNNKKQIHRTETEKKELSLKSTKSNEIILTNFTMLEIKNNTKKKKKRKELSAESSSSFNITPNNLESPEIKHFTEKEKTIELPKENSLSNYANSVNFTLPDSKNLKEKKKETEFQTEIPRKRKFTPVKFTLPAESTISFLLNPIFSNSNPGTIFFQSSSDLLKEIEYEFLQRVDTDKILNWDDEKLKEYRVQYFHEKSFKLIPYPFHSLVRISGLNKVESLLDANFIWRPLPNITEMPLIIPNLNKYQRYNHFPTSYQFADKRYLWLNYKKMNEQFPSDFKFMRETYLLLEDKEEFLEIFNNQPNTLWLQKPYFDWSSRGVEIVTDINSIPENHLVTRYIYNPHLINNKKYDIRLYVLVTSFSPLKIYLFEEGQVRFATEDYSTDEENLKNKFVHLTIMDINSYSDKFDYENMNVNDEFRGSRWSMGAYRRYFKYKNLNFENLWTNIKDLVVKSVIAVTEKSIESIKKLTKHSNTLFEVFGIDILVDDQLNPWLLEYNNMPALNVKTELDEKITTAMLASVMNTIGLIPYSHNDKNKDNPKLIFDDEKKFSGQTCDDPKEMRCSYQMFDLDSYELESSFEIRDYSMEEFSRSGKFERVFPLKSNIDYYSRFVENPGEENLILWDYLKKN